MGEKEDVPNQQDTDALDVLRFPPLGQPPDRGQRRHRQDLDDRGAVPAPGARPWQPRRCATTASARRCCACAVRDPGDDLHQGRHARAVRPHPLPPARSRALLPRRGAAAGRRRVAGAACCRRTRKARRARGAAWRLAMAAESMDDAAVHTIDAWCQRMLREHAFDSGCLFDEELVGERDRDADRSRARLLAAAGLSAGRRGSSTRSWRCGRPSAR